MKNIKKILLSVFVLLLSVTIISCGKKDKEKSVIVFDIPTELRLNEIKYISIMNNETSEAITEYDINFSADDIVLYEKGRLFGYKEGTVDIEVLVDYNNKTYTEEVTLEVKEAKAETGNLNVTGNKGVLVGKEITLKTNAKEDVVFTSSDSSIASVTEDGVVTGVKAGTVRITASLKDNKDVNTVYELTVFEQGNLTKLAGGEYYYEEVLEYNELPFGVTQYTHWGYTKTDNAGIDEDGLGSSKLIVDTNKYYSQQVNVLELPSQLDTKVVVWANTNNHAWTLNSVRAMIQDYEQANPGYTVVAAVNGDFFDINGNFDFRYSTSGATVGDGEFFKTTSGHTIGFKNDGGDSPLVFGVPQKTSYLVLNVYGENDEIIGEYSIESVNTEPEAGKSSIYFGVYNSEHNYVSQNFSTTKETFVVDNAIKTLPHSTSDFYGIGEISSKTQSMTLEKGQFAIVTDNEEIKNALNVGVKIRVQFEYVGDFADISSATGCGDRVLENGELHQDALDSNNLSTRAPRTSIGMREDGTIVMCVIDGRQSNKSMYGLDRNELGSIMKAYGCVCAYNLDGGGSSTMVIRTEDGLKVLNSPSDGSERRDANCVLIVAKDPGYQTSVSDITIDSAVINVSNDNLAYKDYPTYIKINGEFKEVKDGKVVLTGLYHNTKYSYKVYYKNSNGEMVQTLTMNSFKTAKTGFEVLSVVVTETENSFIITLNYLDSDKASNAENAKVIFNGMSTYMFNGYKEVPKRVLGDNPVITTIGIELTYEDNGKTIEYVNENMDFILISK